MHLTALRALAGDRPVNIKIVGGRLDTTQTWQSGGYPAEIENMAIVEAQFLRDVAAGRAA